MMKNNKINRKKRRIKLGKYLWDEVTVLGDFIRLSQTIGDKGKTKTMLLRNLRLTSGEPLCDHIWIKVSDIKNYDLIEDREITSIKFSATPYCYGLDKPTNEKYKGEKYSLKDVYIESYIEKKEA